MVDEHNEKNKNNILIGSYIDKDILNFITQINNFEDMILN